MTSRRPVVVLVIAYNGIDLLDDCLSSVLAADTEELDVSVIVVDNASKDGTARFVSQRFPECKVVVSEKNLGFAAGNNLAWEISQKHYPDCEFVYLLNQDTIVDSGFLIRAIQCLDANPGAGAVQSLLMLHPETNRINTAGNALHFLGFGLPTHYRESLERTSVRDAEIGYPSGAAVLLRSQWLQQHGLFSPELFMYLEDAELGLKLHLTGFPPRLCPASIVYHKYTFGSTLRSYRYLERNRWWLVAVHYRKRTLILLSPMLAIMGCGQWIYAFQHGLLKAKAMAYQDFFRVSFLRSLIHSRAAIQAKRMIGDREMLNKMIGRIESPELTSRVLTNVANPLMGFYLRCLRAVVRW